MPASRPYLDMITRTLGINAQTVLRQGQPCKLCGGFSPPFDSVDFYKYCSPTDCFAFGFAGIHVDYRRCQDCGFIFTSFFDDWTPQEFAAYVYNADYPRIDSEYADIRPEQRRRAAGRTPRPLARHRHPGLRLRLGRLR